MSTKSVVKRSNRISALSQNDWSKKKEQENTGYLAHKLYDQSIYFVWYEYGCKHFVDSSYSESYTCVIHFLVVYFSVYFSVTWFWSKLGIFPHQPISQNPRQNPYISNFNLLSCWLYHHHSIIRINSNGKTIKWFRFNRIIFNANQKRHNLYYHFENLQLSKSFALFHHFTVCLSFTHSFTLPSNVFRTFYT